MAQINEFAFESYVEEIILSKGYNEGSKKEWDKEKALFPTYIINFLKSTQPELWESMYKLQGKDMNTEIIIALCKELDTNGTLDVLRHGFKYRGKRFQMAYFKPAHNLSDDVIKLYNKNVLTITRQIMCHPKDTSEMDITLALNGLPVATIELKNPATHKTYKHAIHQYRNDRDFRAPLFSFKKRALVHFAADPEEVYMTTELKGDKTYFLPFNRGSNPDELKCGAGNPLHSSGYKTGYFWEDILQRDSFIDIFGTFMFVEKEEEKVTDKNGTVKKVIKEKMIFPRYHQIDAVRRLISTAKDEGVGHNYLIQHSAGSGKTKSIAWLSHRLACLHSNGDLPIYDCVVVITDRTVLDKQLQDAIYQIEHKDGVVKCIDENSTQLAESLVDGTKIIITTLQKFPFVLKGLLRVAGADSVYNPDEFSRIRAKEWEEKIASRKYAIVVDEAHSSQTGESVRELKGILGVETILDENSDWEDGLNAVMQARGKQKSISFFAFTATPKGKTLQQFGRKGADGEYHPFHIYSMRQAIEEKFIKDVLKHYTEYNTFYKIASKIEDDKRFSKKKGIKKVAKHLKLHPTNIDQKIEIIVDHFRSKVKHLLNGNAKAMVVTDSRLQVVRYMLALQEYIKEKKYTDIRPLVAFSGEVKDPDAASDFPSYTEPKMNIDITTGKSISERQLPEKFATSDYKILLVANKYQTGFDQPLLCAMYVDKRLDGVQAVQTLSRLNRSYPGKEDPFILDFVNKPADIYAAFKPYYDSTELEKETDPTLLEAIKSELDKMRVYTNIEIEGFAQIFYKPLEKQKPSDHAKMEGFVQIAKINFNKLEKDDQELFKNKMTSFVRLYAFVSQIITYTDEEWEKLYTFSRFLLPHLQITNNENPENPQDDIILTHLRNQKISEHQIDLSDGDNIKVTAPTEVGTKKALDPKVPLSVIIETLNDKFGTDFTDEDRLFFEQIMEKAQKNGEVVRKAKTNPYDKFELGIKEILKKMMMQRMKENDDIVTRYLDDEVFQKATLSILAQEIYANVNSFKQKAAEVEEQYESSTLDSD